MGYSLLELEGGMASQLSELEDSIKSRSSMCLPNRHKQLVPKA